MTRSEDYPPPIVLDTTVLSCFASSEDLYLLDALAIRFVTVEAVVEELRTGVDRGHVVLAPAIEAVDVLTVDGAPGSMLEGLDHGEAHALYAAFQREGTIATDDGPARDRVAALDVPVTGSIGLLLRGVRQERISVGEADALHHHWVTEEDFHSPVSSIADALDRLD